MMWERKILTVFSIRTMNLVIILGKANRKLEVIMRMSQKLKRGGRQDLLQVTQVVLHTQTFPLTGWLVILIKCVITEVCNSSESSFEDRVGYLQHQVPCPTTEEINLPSFSSSQPSKMVQPSNGIWRHSAYHFIRNRGPALESDVLGELGQSIEEHKFPVYKANKFHVKNLKAITDKIDSGNCIMSRNGTYNETPSWPVIIDSASRMDSPYQRCEAIKDENNKHIQSRPSDSYMYLNNSENTHSVNSGLNVALTSGVRCKKHPSKMMEETLLHRKPSQLFVTSKNKGVIPTNRQPYMTATEKLMQHQESEGTPTDSYSSNLRSQQTGSGDSDSKEYSSPHWTRKLRYVSSSRSIESWASPLSQGSESSYTSNSEDEVYSSTSGESTPNGSSNSSYNQPIQRRAGPTYFPRQSTSRKSGNEVINHKQSGTWKRLRNRLAIIFHHHHHHHHHHHNQDDHEAKLKLKGRILIFKKKTKHMGKGLLKRRGNL